MSCRYSLTLIERCYDNIEVIHSEVKASGWSDVVVDVSTCVVLRDVSLLLDTDLSQSLALNVSTLASKYLRCCVLIAPLQQQHSPSR